MNRPCRTAFSLLASLALCSSLVLAQTSAPVSSSIRPGQPWFDTSGHPIDAHGGGVSFFEGTYYWYGEHKIPGIVEGKPEMNRTDGGMHAYSSADLVNWKDEGVVLSVDYNNPKSDLAYGCIFERPKVIYDGAAKKYIAFFKFYPPGTGYLRGYVGTATADRPTGPFIFQGKSLGGNPDFGTGDFALFQDVDGSRYHLAVRKPDRTFVLGKLTPDNHIAPAADYRAAEGVDNATEAPAVIVRKGRYYLFGSDSTGFAANAGRSFVASSIYGPWKSLGNFVVGTNPHNGLGRDKTFGAQISYLIPVQGKPDAWIAMFDIWNPQAQATAMYVWLPVTFEGDKPVVHWIDEWNPTTYFSTGPQGSKK